MSRKLGRLLAATAISASLVGATAAPAAAQQACVEIIIVIDDVPVVIIQCV